VQRVPTKNRAMEAAKRIRELLETAEFWATVYPYDDYGADLEVLVEYVADEPVDAHQFDEAWREFYSAYPNKKAPELAKRALRKLIKREGFEVMPRVMRGLKASIREWARNKTEKQYMPHPASYLNAGRFDDEPAAAGASQKKHGLRL
jgi:hypothetical protein